MVPKFTTTKASGKAVAFKYAVRMRKDSPRIVSLSSPLGTLDFLHAPLPFEKVNEVETEGRMLIKNINNIMDPRNG